MNENLSSNELAKKWANHQVKLPRMPFFYINMYQFTMPLFILVIVDALILYFYEITNLSAIGQMILFPLLFIFNFYLSIWSMVKFCKILQNYWEKKSPSEETVYSREFKDGNVADPRLHYYHLRGFMYKWPVFVAKKTFFPWIVNYVLNEISNNKIHKNAMYGDAYVSLEYSELGDQAIIMEGAAISSHVVDSIYGNLTVEKIILEKQAILHATGTMSPGTILKKGIAGGPHCFFPKGFTLQDDEYSFFWGIPIKKKSYKSFLDILPDDFQKQWQNKKLEKINMHIL